MLAKQLIWTQEEKHKTFSWLEKKEKPEELKSLPRIFTFFPFHWYTAGSPHPAPRIPLLPGLGNKNKHWCFLLTVGKWGKRDPRQQWCSWHGTWGSLGMLERAKSSGLRAWPQGHHTTRAGSPGHRQSWGQRQGWSTPNKQKRICCLGKTGRGDVKSHGPLHIRWAEVWKIRREHLLIASRWR